MPKDWDKRFGPCITSHGTSCLSPSLGSCFRKGVSESGDRRRRHGHSRQKKLACRALVTGIGQYGGRFVTRPALVRSSIRGLGAHVGVSQLLGGPLICLGEKHSSQAMSMRRGRTREGRAFILPTQTGDTIGWQRHFIIPSFPPPPFFPCYLCVGLITYALLLLLMWYVLGGGGGWDSSRGELHLG